MKNQALIVILAILILAFSSTTAFADESDYTWQDNGDGTCTITDYIGPGGDVTITDVLGGLTVTAIGGCAFAHCDNLTSMTLVDGITTIGDCAFSNCSNLKCVIISGSVTTIRSYVFDGCTKLVNIHFHPENEYYSSLDGVLFNKNQTKLIQYPPGRTGAYSILDSVTIIKNRAFYSCSKLNSIVIPNSVTIIECQAFDGCSNLTSVTIPDSVTTINVAAFRNCSGLTSVMIPDSVTTIERMVFDVCSSLVNLTIPNSITKIGHGAFSNCSSLTSLIIPDSVITIHGFAFSNCDSLTNVTISDSVTTIEGGTFSECDNLSGVYFKGDPPLIVGSGIFAVSRNVTIYYIPGTSGWEDSYDGRPTAEWLASPADTDLDYEVDMYDFAVLAENWGRDDCNSSNDWCRWADFDEDGYVDEYDLATLAEQWLFPLGSF